MTQLPQLLALEFVVELGLPEEQDLDQLRRRRLEIREQPNLLEGLGREVLRLVDDQNHSPIALLLVQQILVQLGAQLGAAEPRGQHAELDHDRAEQLVARQCRIEDEGDVRVTAEALEQRAAQRRLAGADFTGDRNEAFALLYAVEQVRQRLAVRTR